MPPRRRIRRTDGRSRQRKMLAAARNPGMGGMTPFGGRRGGGGGVTVVGNRRGGDEAGTDIHHVTLAATAGQTVTAGGGQLMFNRVATAPTEVRGFPTLLKNLAADGSVGAIPCDLTGWAYVFYKRRFATFRQGGTLQVVRTRNGSTVATHGVPCDPPTRAFAEPWGRFWVRAGDTLHVTEPNDSGSGQDLIADEGANLIDVTIVGVAAITSPPEPEGLTGTNINYDAALLSAGTLTSWANTADEPMPGWDATNGPEQPPTVVSGELNGLPVVRFDGADDGISASSADAMGGPSGWSIFFVIRLRSVVSNATFVRMGVGFPSIGTVSDANFTRDQDNGGTTDWATTTTWHLYEHHHVPGVGVEILRDGVVLDARGVSSLQNTWAELGLGFNPASNTNNAPVDLAQFIGITSAVTDEGRRQEIRDFLTDKWGL